MREYLVGYDYGNGGLWAVVIGDSGEDILARYPEVVVVDPPPSWMTPERYQQLREDPIWLDEDISSGIFVSVVADRRRP